MTELSNTVSKPSLNKISGMRPRDIIVVGRDFDMEPRPDWEPSHCDFNATSGGKLCPLRADQELKPETVMVLAEVLTVCPHDSTSRDGSLICLATTPSKHARSQKISVYSSALAIYHISAQNTFIAAFRQT